MAFDISRSTFNPLNDYLGVVMQQGRVHLDSDWNELLAELLRRIHAGTLDIVGQSGVPATTPDAFQINPTTDSSGNVTGLPIGVGRIYVDGILAENHGTGTTQWDPTLGDFVGSTAPDYTQQPYVLGASLPALVGTTQLAYLDVWQREVSFLEDANLVDTALGIDTTGRWQSVWQVKLLDVTAFAGGLAILTPDASLWSAGTAIPAGPIWQTLIQGSPSQLSNGTTTSGYTGQENQLYRVEIHQGGAAASGATLPAPYTAGTATFKWSRENASVATAVTAIAAVTNNLNVAASQLTVASLGRDQVLGFNPNDWIEIIDDYLELNGTSASAGSASSLQPGELHQIVSTNSNAGVFTITLDGPVIGNFNPTDSTRHTRIRRWDQQGSVYLSDGQTVWADLANTSSQGIPVPPPGTSLILENGVTVSFGLAAAGSGNFQTGDYWMFAARAADGSLTPQLTAATPIGPEHHIARLAILNFSAAPATVIDCRNVAASCANQVVGVQGVSAGGVQLTSASAISTVNLSSGITIIFDSPIDNGSTAPYPDVTVSAQLPVSGQPWSQLVLLSGALDNPPAPGNPPANSLTWTPSANFEDALASILSPGSQIPARLVLKGDTVRAAGGPPYLYLNGATPPPYLNGTTPVPDGRAYADFDVSFTIISPPLVQLAPTALNFPVPQIVGTSTSLPVTLTNNSNAGLSIDATTISVTGANAADFTVTNLPATPVPADGGSCVLDVVFNPMNISPLTATRVATLNFTIGIDSALQPIPLQGQALAPWITGPAGINFAFTFFGATNTQVGTIGNSGSADLSILGVGLSVTGSPSFQLPAQPLEGDVPPGGTFPITVQFVPNAFGLLQSTLVIIHNAYGSPLMIPLSGYAYLIF